MTRKVAIYARVSSASQTTDHQLLALRGVVGAGGFTLVHEYVETASGATADRPMLKAMLADAARRKFAAVLVWDVSRLGRSLRDLVDIFETFRALGIDLLIHQSGVDTSTPAGRALLQIAGVFSEFERSMIVERTMAGLATARARGVRLGRPPSSDGLAEAIRALRLQKVGINSIARELRCGKSTVAKVIATMAEEATHAH